MTLPNTTMRAFIAINCPADIQHSIQSIQSGFKPHSDAWRWVPPENLHLTLQFLGNISETSTQAIAQAMAQAVAGQSPFSLYVRGLGCFPHPDRPRVLWMGIDDPARMLQTIYRQLTSALSQLGFASERQSFRPHLTLARRRRQIDKAALRVLLNTYQSCQFGVISVDRIHLYHSQLHRNGATHVILKSVDL